MQYSVESAAYRLQYEIEEGYAVITGFEGVGSRMFVPDMVPAGGQVYPVRRLGKKAILANKGLREISLPGSVNYFDDWCMAQCENMQKVILRESMETEPECKSAQKNSLQESMETEPECKSVQKNSLQETMDVNVRNGNMQKADSHNGFGAEQLYFGKGVFDKCNKLQDICLGYERPDDLSALLGSVIYRMPAEYLLRDKELGQAGWFEKWDQCLSVFLNEPDLDGYTDMVLCGEEDIFYKEPDFAIHKRKKKASLCLLRLMHDSNLKESLRQKFQDYLLQHTKGCTGDEAWQVLLDEYGESVSYFKLFADLGCVTKDNIEGMLSDMGQQYAESKAFLLNYKQTRLKQSDVFSMFDL